MVRRLTIVLTVFLVEGVAARIASAADDQRIQQLERQMAEMQKELQALREERRQEREAATTQQTEAERKTNVLAEEFEKLKTNLTVPEDVEYKSLYGFGPAASRVYTIKRGLSIGGYFEGYYSKLVSDKTSSSRDTSDFIRGVLYFGYKFNDWILFNSEIEIEHAFTQATKSSSAGEVAVEFAYLDFLLSNYANARVGLLLMPMGFINEIHEPNTYFGVFRPEVEQRIIPTTWRENGVGLFGKLGEDVQYRLYANTGLNARGFAPVGLRNARQRGDRAIAEDISVVGRIDYTPIPSVLLGGSFFTGDQGQDQVVSGTDIPATNLTLWELHGQYRAYGLELRTLFAMANIGDARQLTEALRITKDIGPTDTIANTMLGTYFEVGYDVLPLIYPGTEQYLAPFVRFEYYDTQYSVPGGFDANSSAEQRLWTTGLSYKPHPNVVLKVDYRDFSLVSGERPDEVNFGIGLAY
jgi:Ni/Co efflux regulator RcnB